MRFEFSDINNFEKHANPEALAELEDALTQLKLHIIASGEEGRTGSFVFNQKATNEALGLHLKHRGWDKIVIPPAFKAFGKDVDFGKDGLLAESQFSNYPFFANNVLRIELFFRHKLSLKTVGTVKAGVIITKGGIFDSQKSTLYYEQAVSQLRFLDQNQMIRAPLRVIGLTALPGETIPAVLTHYPKGRSRTVKSQQEGHCNIGQPTRGGRQAQFKWLPSP